MAGHSQFKNIMHRKGAQDIKRAKIFAKLSREIMVAAKTGLPDPNFNPRLRSALAAARAANMPKDNIDRALKKAAGGEEGANFEEVRYEGYGPNGVAIIVETLTDNRNRTASEVRSVFSKHGGALGETGSVSFQFERLGLLRFPLTIGDFAWVFEYVVEAGADDLDQTEEGYEITCAFDAFSTVRDLLMEKLGDPLEAKVIWKPVNEVPCSPETLQTIIKMVDILDDNDDVQNVYVNAEVTEV